jgi:hypothetical protein
MIDVRFVIAHSLWILGAAVVLDVSRLLWKKQNGVTSC